MILNGQRYFKEAYLRHATKETLQKIAFAVIKWKGARFGGHDFAKDDLPNIERKIKGLK